MSNGHQIATTILEQLGGNQFVAMVGPKDMTHGEDYLQFRLPRGSAKNKATHVRIRLLDNDNGYTIEFIKVGRSVLNIKTVSEFEVIPENMRELFTRETGLDCTLGTMGKV